MANALFDADIPVPAYRPISALTATEPGTPPSSSSLTYIDFYMDDVIVEVQGGQSDNTESAS